MKIFHWSGTSCNQLYGGGNIIVAAGDIEEARAAVMRCAETASLGYNDMTTPPYDDDDIVRRSEVLGLVRKDIAKEPAVYAAPHAIFINGSE